MSTEYTRRYGVNITNYRGLMELNPSIMMNETSDGIGNGGTGTEAFYAANYADQIPAGLAAGTGPQAEATYYSTKGVRGRRPGAAYPG